MSFAELVAEVASRTGTSRKDVARILRGFTDVTITTVKTGERVTLPGFGTFLPHDVFPKVLFGGTRKSGRRRKIRFRQSRRMP